MKKNLSRKDYPIFYFLLLFILTFGFQSCEFDSDDDNYVEVERPKEEVPISIDLAGVNPEEIIYVRNNTYFEYTLFTDNRQILKREFYLDGNPIYSGWSESVLLKVEEIDKEIHELKLVISLKTETGSLADYAGLEKYIGEYTFKLKFIPDSNDLKIRQTSSSEGYLKLEWDKPDYEVSSYDIYDGKQNLLITISDPNQRYFVDTNYLYGYKSYKIIAHVKNSFDIITESYHTAEYISLTEKDFKTYRISGNEFSIKWKNPNTFPCKYVLKHWFDDEKYIVDGNVTEAIMKDYYFPSNVPFFLFILPISADVNDYDKYPYVSGEFGDSNVDGNNFIVDPFNKQLHSIDFHIFESFDIFSMQKISSVEHNLNVSSAPHVEVAKDGKVAIGDANFLVHIYSDATLKNEIATFPSGFYGFTFVGNNKIVTMEYNEIKLYDIKTKKMVYSKKWDVSTSVGISVSSDGKYLYANCSNKNAGVELYEIRDNNLILLERTDRPSNLWHITFSPLKPTEAIFQYGFAKEYFIIQDIITKEKKEFDWNYINTDPFTGNILYTDGIYDNNSAYVIDKTYSKTLITLRFANHVSSNPYMYNNNLISGTCYLDLTTLKEWNQ